MRILLLLFSFLVFSSAVFAQNNKVKAQLQEFENSNDYAKSIIELRKILAENSLTVRERVEVQQTLVHMYQGLEMWDTCLQYCQSQIIAAQHDKNTYGEATFYKLIGNTFYRIRKKDFAYEYWEKCVRISEVYHYDTLLEMCYHNLGLKYLELATHLDSAEYFLKKALEKGLVNYPKASSENCLHKRLLGTYYATYNQIDKAEVLFLEAISDCRLIKDTPRLAELILFYTDVLAAKKEYQKALDYSAEGLALSRKVKFIDGESTALDFYALNLYRLGRFEEAYLARCEMTDFFKKRFDIDLNQKMSESEAKFRNAEIKHEHELALSKAKQEKQKMLLLGIGKNIVVIFTSLYLFQRQANKQRIQLQKERLQSILAGEEKERTRIAKDLHDGIVQDLTAIKMHLKASLKDEGSLSKEALANSVNAIDKASQEVRNIAYQMMPNTLRELGFVPAIEDLLKRILTPNNIQYDFEQIGVTDRISPEIEVSLFRITQELINNVIKHSGASFVSLMISQKPESITLIFEDNGTGFDIAQIQKGIGIESLRSRVDLLHGRINYENQSGNGTMAIINIPLTV